MSIGIPVFLVVAGGFFLLVVLFFLFAKPVDVEPRAESDDDVKGLALRGKKVTAINEYRRLHGVGLAEAKAAVEEMVSTVETDELTRDKLNEIQRLVNRGEKIAAIKVYRNHFNVGLKEAKECVELMEK